MFLQVTELKISPYVFPGIRYLRGTCDLDIAEKILDYICEYYGEQKINVQSKTRKQCITQIRDWCVYFIYFKTSLTLERIGKLFYPQYDHSDVISAKKRVITQLSSKYENIHKTDYTRLTEMLLKRGII